MSSDGGPAEPRSPGMRSRSWIGRCHLWNRLLSSDVSVSDLVHLTCQSVGSAFEDLSQLVTKMFQTPESQEPGTTRDPSPDLRSGLKSDPCSDPSLVGGRPTVLWSLYFNMADGSVPGVEGQGLPSNVHVCSGPEGSLDHEHSIKQVRCPCAVLGAAGLCGSRTVCCSSCSLH